MEADISVQTAGGAGDQPDHPEQLDHRLEEAGRGWLGSDYSEQSDQPEEDGSQDLSFLFPPMKPFEEETEENRDIYLGEDANTRMTHLMHSDTMIVVAALIAMIVLGLIFRSLCMRLTSKNNRKERIRGGLRAMAENMHVVTKSMCNDLEQEDAAKTVMRTSSNYGRTRPGEKKEGDVTPSPVRHPDRENWRVQAFSSILAKEEVSRPGLVSIEMTEVPASPAQRQR
jgi:hypothetical protein